MPWSAIRRIRPEDLRKANGSHVSRQLNAAILPLRWFGARPSLRNTVRTATQRRAACQHEQTLHQPNNLPHLR